MMPRKKDQEPLPTLVAEPLYVQIRAVLESARTSAYRAVNFAMVQAYWQVGRLIVEDEQNGVARADYGKAVIKSVSARLTQDFGKGFDERNLWHMRRFYLAFPILNAPRSESPAGVGLAEQRADLAAVSVGTLLRPELSWTHYRLLLNVDEPQAREWYMNEAADQHWSTRQLERQISVLYYERLLANRVKPGDRAAALSPRGIGPPGPVTKLSSAGPGLKDAPTAKGAQLTVPSA